MARGITVFSMRIGVVWGCLWIINVAAQIQSIPECATANYRRVWSRTPNIDVTNRQVDLQRPPSTSGGVSLDECKRLCVSIGCRSLEYQTVQQVCRLQSYSKTSSGATQIDTQNVDYYDWECKPSGETTTTTTTTTKAPTTITTTTTTTTKPTKPGGSTPRSTESPTKPSTPTKPTMKTTPPKPTTKPTPEPTTPPQNTPVGIRFKLDAGYDQHCGGDKEEACKAAITDEIKEKAKITDKRIANLKVEPGSIDVEFVLMPGTKDEPTTKEVKENLKNIVMQDKLAVSMQDQEVKAVPDSFDTFDPEDKGSGEPEGPVDKDEDDDDRHPLLKLKTEYYVLIGMGVMVVLLIITAVCIVCQLTGRKK